MFNKIIFTLLFIISLLIILVASITPIATDSWNLINSAKANLQVNDYKLYPGVGVAVEILFRGVKSNSSFETRYFLISFISSLALIIQVIIICTKYLEANLSTAIWIGYLTYLMGPFQLGGLYWDYFYLMPLFSLIILLNEISLNKNKYIQIIYTLISGALVTFLILGKQNSAVLTLLLVVILAIITGRFIKINFIILFLISFIVSFYIITEIFELVNITMMYDHLIIPFRYSVEASGGSEGVYKRLFYRLFPLIYGIEFDVNSIAFYIYANFQTQLMLVLTIMIIIKFSRKEFKINRENKDAGLFIYLSIFGVYFIYIITIGRNWGEIYPLGPMVIYLLLRENAKYKILSKKIIIFFKYSSIAFVMVSIAIPLRNYYKIYTREYDQPYGLLVFGSYATGNYFSPKEAIKILREKKCVEGIGGDISPLLYLGSSYCSSMVQVDQSIKSRDISYVSILKKMKINDAIFINSCVKTDNCFIANYFKEFNLIDFVGSEKPIYKSGNIEIYNINE